MKSINNLLSIQPYNYKILFFVAQKKLLLLQNHFKIIKVSSESAMSQQMQINFWFFT